MNKYGNYSYLIPLYYITLCYTLQGAVLELSSLAKPYQPDENDDQVDPVDFPEGNELDTPTSHGNP